MKLGSYLEIVKQVPDLAKSGEYYSKLGLNKVADNVYGDGRYHLRLEQGSSTSPVLRYYGSDIPALKASGVSINSDNSITSPGGITVELHADAPPLQLPFSEFMSAEPSTRLGKFGEFAIFVPELKTEAEFWEKVGYSALHQMADPEPWGIWLDGLFSIGIHQPAIDVPVAITHFSGDMLAVNTALKNEGFAIETFTDDGTGTGTLEHSKLTTPDGLLFYLFTGEI